MSGPTHDDVQRLIQHLGDLVGMYATLDWDADGEGFVLDAHNVGSVVAAAAMYGRMLEEGQSYALSGLEAQTEVDGVPSAAASLSLADFCDIADFLEEWGDDDVHGPAARAVGAWVRWSVGWQVAQACGDAGGDWPTMTAASQALAVDWEVAQRLLDAAVRSGQLHRYAGDREALGHRLPPPTTPA